MAHKGCKNCCCNGCYNRPMDRSLSSEALQPFEQYCCTCIPRRICVEIYSYDTGATTTTVFARDCSAVRGDPIMYSGTAIIDRAEVDLQFIFKVENGICYMCVRSDALNIDETDPDSCFVVDNAKREPPDNFCWTMGASWVIQNLIITIAATNSTAITGRSDCLDDAGNVVTDTNPIKDICGGCSCICQCACIISFGDNMDAVAEVACLEGTVSYRTYSGIEIELSANYTTGCCQLELVDYGNTDIDPDTVVESSFLIGDAGSLCPNPTGFFSGFTPAGDARFILFRCNPCGECETIPELCCDGGVPLILTATVTTSCPDCGSFTMSLVYDDDFGAWIGEQPELFCGHSIRLVLACSGYSWTLVFTGDPCTTDSDTAAGGACSPLSLSFSLGPLGGLGCCGVASVLTPTVTVVVTE